MLHRYRVHILPRASLRLVQIFDFIEHDSPQNAASIIQALIAAIDSLDQFPRRFKIHRSRQNPDHIIHAMSVPPFIIYYRTIERDALVEVLTVRHGAQKPPSRHEL